MAIAGNKATTARIDADAVTGAKIADDAINSEHYTDGSIDNAHIADDQINSEHYADGSIDTAHIADDQVTYAKMQHTSTANRVLGAASAGAIGEVQVATAMIAADAVNGDKLADDACNSEHYTDGSIDTAHIADSQVTADKLASNAVTNAKMADNAVDSAEIASGAIDTAHIADNQVTVAKLVDLARGSIVIGNASAASAELTKGSANTVLTSDGTDISWAAGGGDLVFLVENSVAGGVHLSTAFSSTYITSTYERYLITFQDLDFNNDNVTFYAQISADNGSSYKTSGYRTAGYYNEYNGSATNQAADNTASYLMAATSVGNAATESLSGHMWLINPANSSTFAQAYWDLVYDAEDSYTRRYIGAGNWATAGAINNIKFAPSGGVWNSGKICVYGVKNS